METAIAEALKGANSPLLIIIIILIAKDFYQSRAAAKEAADNAALTTTLRSIADSLTGLCVRVDRLVERVNDVERR